MNPPSTICCKNKWCELFILLQRQQKQWPTCQHGHTAAGKISRNAISGGANIWHFICFLHTTLDKQFPIGLEEGTLWGEAYPRWWNIKNIICHNLLWEPPRRWLHAFWLPLTLQASEYLFFSCYCLSSRQTTATYQYSRKFWGQLQFCWWFIPFKKLWW